MFSWQNSLEEVIDDYKDKRYTFNCIDELNIIIANKMDMSYDFYNKHIMCALEWNLFAMINKDETLINKLNHNWRHPKMRTYSDIPINNKCI